MEERYEPLKELGSGNFGVARLVRDKKTKELVAVKYIERGKKIDENVKREIINHRALRHPNIVRFKEVLLDLITLMEAMDEGQGAGYAIYPLQETRALRSPNPPNEKQNDKEIDSGDSRKVVTSDNNVVVLNISCFTMSGPVGYFTTLEYDSVLLTPTHLAIVMEYAAGGELFERICSAGRFSEDEARFFFQQLISGVSYCHSMQICHRDLKLENTLLDGNATPRLKICDFGYSKSALLHSQPKSTVGTPAYIAPEVLSRKEYDGKIADVWSCGVTLYVMLVGAYPFEDPDDPRNIRKAIGRIMGVQYSIPDYVRVSADCRQLLTRIFVANPAKRITIPEIKKHPWFLKNLPKELVEYEKNYEDPNKDQPAQSIEEINRIIEEARVPAKSSKAGGPSSLGLVDPDDGEADVESEVDNSVDYASRV